MPLLLLGLCAADDEKRLVALKNVPGLLKSKRSPKLSSLLLNSLVHDPSHPIRHTAIKLVIQNFDLIVKEENVSILYQRMNASLFEELYPFIRYDIMCLLHLCSLSYPQNTVKLSSYSSSIGEQEYQLNEATFILLGSTISDPCKHNRALSCQLLGTITNGIEDEIKCQLLSKEIPGAVNVKGRELRLPWTFCGSFIIALEDEYEQVRLAAIEAMKNLASSSTVFASRALDFFVDSFQDECTTVRVASFIALQKILPMQKLPIQLNHLEGILSHLDDTEIESRVAVRRLVSIMEVADEDSLLKTMKCIPIAIEKFKAEDEQFFEALFSFGQVNSKVVGECCMRLLKAEKFFLIPEPKIEDRTYTVRLATILGALYAKPELDPLIPAFVYRHYHYFQAKHPNVAISFVAHQLHDRFYNVAHHLTPKLLSSEQLQKSLLERLQKIVQLMMGTGGGEKVSSTTLPLLTLLDNVRNNVAQFQRHYQRLLLLLISQLLLESKVPMLKIILEGFENVNSELVEAIGSIEKYLLTHPPNNPSSSSLLPPLLPNCPDLVELEVNFQAIPFTKEKPITSFGNLPIIFTIQGTLSFPTSKTIKIRVKAIGLEKEEGEAFFFPIKIVKGNFFASLIRLPISLVSSLPVGLYGFDLDAVVMVEATKVEEARIEEATMATATTITSTDGRQHLNWPITNSNESTTRLYVSRINN